MNRIVLLFAGLCLAAPCAAQPQPPAQPLSLEQRLLLRCSAMFALVAGEQQRGAAWAGAYPPLGERGREYFVQASARLMDELRLSREELAGSLRSEVAIIEAQAAGTADRARYLDGLMQPCLAALEASGL